MTPTTCVITGATSGIGRATALGLAGQGARLVLLGRNKHAGNVLVRRISRLGTGATAEFVDLDLSCLSAVRTTGHAIVADHSKIDVLISNAGARYDRFQESTDGFELTLATNHLGHFLLTALLLPSLLAAQQGRIVTVSSVVHRRAHLSAGWRNERAGYDRHQAYARSKLANVVFALELARRLKGTRVTSNAYDPGIVASRFARNNGLVSWLKHLIAHGLRRQLVLPRTAATGLIRLAVAPKLADTSGRYFHGLSLAEPAQAATESSIVQSLWDLSVRQCALDEKIGPAWHLLRPETP